MSTAPLLPGFHAPEPPPFVAWVAFPRDAIRDPRLNHADRTVLALVVDLTGQRIDYTRASNAELARELHMDEGSVRKSLVRLEAAGYLARTQDRTHSAYRRIDLQFRTWDPPDKGAKDAPKLAQTPPQVGAGAYLDPTCTDARRAPAPTQVGAGAYPDRRRRPPLFHIVSKKELKPSKDETTLPLPENGPEGGAPQTCEAGKVAPRAEAHQDEAPPPPSAEQIAEWHDWIREGQPVLVRIAQASLREAGLEVPDLPARPAESVPSEPAGAAQERQETTPTDSDAARTAQDATGTPRDDRDEQSNQEPPRAQSEPLQPAPTRPPVGALADLPAVNWSAMMQRCTQMAARGTKARTLVGEGFLRLWVETDEAIHLEATLNAWSAHWRDWKRESREHWASCVGEIRTGLVTIDEILSIVADAERRQVTKRAHYFSHHVGDMLRLKRAQKTAPPGCS